MLRAATQAITVRNKVNRAADKPWKCITGRDPGIAGRKTRNRDRFDLLKLLRAVVPELRAARGKTETNSDCLVYYGPQYEPLRAATW